MGHDGRPLALAAAILAAGAASLPAAQTSATAAKALEDCRARVIASQLEPALERCTEALRLDPALFEAYLARGFAHHQLAGRADLAAPGVPEAMAPPISTQDAQVRDHRGRAIADYKKYFGLNPGETDDQRLNKRRALSGLVLVLSLHDVKDSSALSYASLLVEQPSLGGEDALNLARLYERYERPDLAEEAYKRFSGTDLEVCAALGGLYSRRVWNGRARFDDAVSTLERCATLAPGDPRPHQWLAALFWEKAYHDPALTDTQKLTYADRGLTHADRALAVQADAIEAVIYKGLLLRTKARSVQDPAQQKRLIDEAAAMQRRAVELRAKRGLGDAPAAAAPPPSAQSGPIPPPLPPPPPAGPLRVGGQIKEPKKLEHVPPVYPEIAKQARVQGVVILECTISPAGKVEGVRVLRSIPLLDDAAVEAVKQWVYTPTLMNGVPSPVIAAVTVGFQLGDSFQVHALQQRVAPA